MRRLAALALVGALLGCKAKEAPPAPQTTASSPTAAAATTPAIGKGDKAPDFSLPGSDGKTHALADHLGKEVVVVAWFPKAFTGG